MSDFEYTCFERKQLARQASHRRNGSKSKRCSLPSDKLTNKQWKERNGAIVSANFNKPMSWQNFIQLSAVSQMSYMKQLQSTYNATLADFSRMFKVGRVKIKNQIERNQLGIEFPTGVCMNKTQRAEWSKFLNSDAEKAKVEPELSTVSKDENSSTETIIGEITSPTDKPQFTTPVMRMNTFSLNFSGAIDVDGIANSLKRILGEGAVGQVEIRCSLAE